MAIKKCHICGSSFIKGNRVLLKNMPKAAQFMPDKKSLYKEKGITIELCQCAGCGVVQLLNKPVPYYKNVIRSVSVSDEMKKFRIKQFKKFIEKYDLKGKKIIEIGCGNGDYLEIMKMVGPRVFGIENSKDAVKNCIKKGLNVQKGFVTNEKYKIYGAPFDGFFIMNFLEHIPQAKKLLLGIANNLSENAIGLIEVPNFNMIIKQKLYTEIIRDHIFYFTKETLTNLLRISGFTVIECSEIMNDYIISMVVKKINQIDVFNIVYEFKKLKNEINRYILKLKKAGKKIAIWGAGHQAFTLMSVCGLTDKIEYVVDSAKFKQGKFTPVTHIPIVAPEALNENPVNAIIVIAGAYSEEVVRIIRKKYASIKEVAVFKQNKILLIK
jgi:2-polyprenyl-3-methyl-5-hydroxy-6-metoxy-1,4-benzoquinol methylase